MLLHDRARAVVLLAEPSSDDRGMYAEYLRAHDYLVIESADTLDALTRADGADVVVCGIRMRGPFDGIELVRRLRQTARFAARPIIVLTACQTEPDQMRAMQAGCDAFLAKPCLPETLLARIVDAIDPTRRAARSSERHDGRLRSLDALPRPQPVRAKPRPRPTARPPVSSGARRRR